MHLIQTLMQPSVFVALYVIADGLQWLNDKFLNRD
jgi:hypothetical protein